MTITADQLGQALSPFKGIQKRERVPVDLGKVAHALVGHMVDATKSDDPEAAFDSLEKSVDEIDRYLAKAQYDVEADEIFLDTVQGDEIASRFEKDKAGHLDDEEEDKRPAFLRSKDKKTDSKKDGGEDTSKTGEEEDTSKTSKTGEDEDTSKTGEEDTSKTGEDGETSKTDGGEGAAGDDAAGSTTEGGEETSTEKGDEFETRDFDVLDTEPWGSDMSPERPPTLRSERMTKAEFAVGGASRTGNSRREKYLKAREKAMARRDGYDERMLDE